MTNLMMNGKKSACCFTALLAALVLWPVPAGANGYRLPNQDPEAIARGNAFVATADNPSAIYYNPAGIAQLEGNYLQAGAYFGVPGVDFQSRSGAKANVGSDINTVPQIYYVYAPHDFPLAFGLGLYVPYGLSLNWSQPNPFRTVAENGSLLYLTINPVVAWKVHRTLSLAVGPTINYSQASLQRGIGVVPNDQFNVSGDGWAPGFNAGVLWQPLPKWAFGLNYRFGTTIDYSGTSSSTPSPPLPPGKSTQAAIRFPQFAVAGVSFRPTDKWNVEFDLDWTDWGDVKDITFLGTAFGKQTLPLNFTSSFMYEFGVTRQLSRGYFVSLGYCFSENSSPSRNFTPIIPDSDLHLGGIGFGRKGKRWDWAVAYQFGYNPSRQVANDQTSPLANGAYHIFNNALNLAATYKF